jgi:hypothetical protein
MKVARLDRRKAAFCRFTGTRLPISHGDFFCNTTLDTCFPGICHNSNSRPAKNLTGFGITGSVE